MNLPRLNLKSTHGLLAAMLLAFASAAPADNGDFSDSTLESFLMARADVRQIQDDYSSRLEDVTDNEKVAKLRAEAREKMVQAVQAEDLTVEEYNRISNRAMNDAALRERLQQVAE